MTQRESELLVELDLAQNVAQGEELHLITLSAVLGLVLGDDLGSVHNFQRLQGCEQNQVRLQGQEALVTVFLESLLQDLEPL